MAGAGYKLFNTGDVLTAAQVNTYLQEQVVMVFANAAARTTALSGVLAEGMVTYLKDTDALEIYSGAAWVGYGSGDITGVTAGTGISGGGTSGTVTITNSMATEITAAGDIIVGTGSGTFDNLPIGTTGQVLTADTTVSPYKVKWATASSGGMTSIASGTLSGSSVVISSIPTGYVDLVLYVTDFRPATDGAYLDCRLNGDTNNRYDFGAGGSDVTNRSATSNDRLRFTWAADDTVGDGIVKATFFDYTNTNIWKYGQSIAFNMNWVTSSNFDYRTMYLLYNQTSAISSITLLCSSGNFNAGSYVLYGVK